MRSKSEAKILEAAIELFAKSGYAASARDIAEHAGTTTMTMYRAFHNRKEHLFAQALDEVINRSFDPGKFVLFIYEDQKCCDFASVLLSGLQRWYSAIQLTSAQLLAQACLSGNRKWREAANAALERIVAVLTTTIERQLSKDRKREFDARAVARVLIAFLFQMKWNRLPKPQSPKAEKEEAREIAGLLECCFEGFASALKR
jgi:AcrR family transcriptional regulator